MPPLIAKEKRSRFTDMMHSHGAENVRLLTGSELQRIRLLFLTRLHLRLSRKSARNNGFKAQARRSESTPIDRLFFTA